ncbi:putative acyl-CoA dehydrogenase/oxidase [Septoria linicola]|nr:putative acyl-CoA dehydrogenase/oxidase [Septoria linicola]
MPIDFTLTPEQVALKASARNFAETVLAPCPAQYLQLPTQFERFRATQDAYRRIVEGGWIKMQIPEEYGGTRKSLVDVALKKEFISPFLTCNGTPLAALGFSEPTGSANWLQNEGGRGIQTLARIEGGEVIMNGGKVWASSSGGWDFKGPEVLCLVCRFGTQGAPADTVGIVVITRKEFDDPKNARCFRVGGDIETHGFRAHSGPRTFFADFRVPVKNILATPGKGALVNVAAFTESAALVGAGAAGLMRSCFEHTLKIVTTDKRRGSKPTIEYQSVTDFLISMKMRLETTRYLTWKACHYLDTTGEAELAYQAKVYGSETAVQCVLEAMQAVGVTAYDVAQPYGLMMDDAICLPLFEGSNTGIRRCQIQKILSTAGYDPDSCASNTSWSKAREGYPERFWKCHI